MKTEQEKKGKTKEVQSIEEGKEEEEKEKKTTI